MGYPNNYPTADPTPEQDPQCTVVPPVAGCVTSGEAIEVPPAPNELITIGGATLRIYGQPETD